MTTHESGGPSAEAGTTLYAWCSAGERVLHGRMRPGPPSERGFWRRLLQGRHPAGMIYEFEAIDRECAQAALERFLEDPGNFAIETREGARIDFLASRRSPLVTLDCWFFDTVDDLDTVVVRRADANSLIETLYSAATDAEVAAVIFELAARAQRIAG